MNAEPKKKKKRWSYEKVKMTSTWLQILASVCAIVAFYWEYRRRKNQVETTETEKS